MDKWRPSIYHVQVARKLRQNMSPPEKLLWRYLRRSIAQPFPMRRQLPLHGYVIDFAYLPRKLAFEIDGKSHEWTSEEDAKRDQVLSSYGWTVHSFSASRVFENAPGVADLILKIVQDSE